MTNLDDWKTGDPIMAAKLQQCVTALRESALLGADGATIFQTPGGMTLRSAPAEIARPGGTTMIRIQGFAITFTGDTTALTLPGGYYFGTILERNSTKFPVVTSGTDLNLATYFEGTYDEATLVIVVNSMESNFASTEHNTPTNSIVPCENMNEATEAADNDKVIYKGSNGMTFDLYRFHGFSFACGLA